MTDLIPLFFSVIAFLSANSIPVKARALAFRLIFFGPEFIKSREQTLQ